MTSRPILPFNKDFKLERSPYCADPNCISCAELRLVYEELKNERAPTVHRTGVPADLKLRRIKE